MVRRYMTQRSSEITLQCMRRVLESHEKKVAATHTLKKNCFFFRPLVQRTKWLCGEQLWQTKNLYAL